MSRYCRSNFQDNSEYNSILPFRIILKIFVVNMLTIIIIMYITIIVDHIATSIFLIQVKHTFS